MPVTLIGLLGGLGAGALQAAICAPGIVMTAPINGFFALMLVGVFCLVFALLFLRGHLVGLALGYLAAILTFFLLGRTDLAGLKLGLGTVVAGLLLTPVALMLSAMLPGESGSP